jgi:hypothetical protein
MLAPDAGVNQAHCWFGSFIWVQSTCTSGDEMHRLAGTHGSHWLRHAVYDQQTYMWNTVVWGTELELDLLTGQSLSVVTPMQHAVGNQVLSPRSPPPLRPLSLLQ